MSSLPTATTTFGDESEKYNQASLRDRKAKRRRYLIVLASALVIFVYLFSLYNTTINNPFAGFFSKVKTWTGCNSSGTMASAHSAAGWHARSTEHTGTFAPVKADVLLNVLVNSQVEPEGFTLSLVKPNLAVDARGKVLTVPANDFAAFEAEIKKVKDVPQTGNFKGQWRVKQQRTSYPIDIIQIPGEAERSVYGWSATTTTLEETTKGHTTLPEPLQTLIGWAKEAREGYQRGQADQTVIGKVKDLLE